MMHSLLTNDRAGFLASIVAALIAVAFLTPAGIMSTFIVLGQGHFLLAYLYQWRAGKIGWRYGALYAIAFSVLLIAYQFIPEPKLWTFLIAGSIFSVHFFVDEYFLAKIAWSIERILLGVVFVGLYGALLLRALYFIEIPDAAPIIALLLLVPLVAQSIRERSLQLVDVVFMLAASVLVVLLVQPYVISLHAALGCTILAHYVRWYLHFYGRLKTNSDQARLKKYLIDVVVVNVLVVALFGVYVLYRDSLLRYAFEPTFFFIWTILHVLFSIRLSPAVQQRFGLK